MAPYIICGSDKVKIKNTLYIQVLVGLGWKESIGNLRQIYLSQLKTMIVVDLQQFVLSYSDELPQIAVVVLQKIPKSLYYYAHLVNVS